MWIERIDINFGSFDGTDPIRFMPGVNIIRGENGIGKTTLLELASLLGHVALMTVAQKANDERVDVHVVLEPTDMTFLAEIKRKLVETLSTSSRNDDAKVLASDDWVEAYLYALRFNGLDPAKAAEVSVPESGALTLSFFLDGVNESEIKSILSSDERIRKSIRVFSDDGDPLVVQMLNCWSRPFCEGNERFPGPWRVTPRTILKGRGKAEVDEPGATVAARPSCGATFYMNTDMYEFGAGLDVRESPKDLKENLSAIMIRRLQLVRPDSKVDTFPYLDKQFDLNIAHEIDGFADIQASWEYVFGKMHPLTVARAKRVNPTSDGDECTDLSCCFEWNFKIGSRERKEFVSSGENQALFVLAMLCNMATAGSCVLIDEPELHLTFFAGTRLMHRIRELAKKDGRQFCSIVVTYLQDLYPRSFVRRW